MQIDKTQLDSNLDLSLYIEGLLRQEDPAIETKIKYDNNNSECLTEPENNEDFNSEEQHIEKFNIPSWGSKPFECLLVKTTGMEFMLPAMLVNYIEKINKKITRIPLDAVAFKGVVTLREKSVAVIDLLSLVSEDKSIENKQTSCIEENQINNVIVMEDSSYALACDDVSQLIMLNPEDARWNRASFNNPMFTGIVTEYLCPIINIDYLSKRIAEMPFVQSLNQ